MSCWCKDCVVISSTEWKEKVCESFCDIWWRDQSLSFVHMYGVHVQCNSYGHHGLSFGSAYRSHGVIPFSLLGWRRLFVLTSSRIRFLKFFKVLMVQMEFAKKLMAKPGEEYPLRMLWKYNNNIYLDPPRVSNFIPQVYFWWLRDTNFTPLEDSGMYILYKLLFVPFFFHPGA